MLGFTFRTWRKGKERADKMVLCGTSLKEKKKKNVAREFEDYTSSLFIVVFYCCPLDRYKRTIPLSFQEQFVLITFTNGFIGQI